MREEIEGKYFMNYFDYCEVKLTSKTDENGMCYRCNKPLEPLTIFLPGLHYQPCWDCVLSNPTIDKDLTRESLIKSMHDIYTRILGDRYYQLFLVDDIYQRTTFPHSYNIFKKTVNSLEPPSRNDIWFLDWQPGYPKLINIDNIPGIKIVNLTSLYNPEVTKERVRVGSYEIIGPEITNFDYKHYSRYSLLNKNLAKKTQRRFKIGDKCVKFYNTPNEEVKSLFRIMKDGEPITLRNLTYQDYVVIKLMIMRNKTFLRLVFEIIEEVSRQVGVFYDTVFLKNKITLNPKKDTSVSLVWSEISKEVKPGIINLSII